ncbi:TPA: hypothetical protein I7259_02375 [Vibrio parahaemolyticus]|nr:hypothetical protein [Vibrio parahaemolyticus]HCG5486991.1 hypothetical protein [Vibrio parahaemolyticus]HCH0842014.1 hypothetical protein [Vibrio parahaemolyticus]
MDIEALKKLIASSSEEVDHLEKLASKLSLTEYNELKRTVLRKFIRNESSIDHLVTYNTHTHEISRLLEMADESWFIEAINLYLDNFHAALNCDKKRVISIIEEDYDSIHQGLNAYHDAFFISNINNKMKLRHFARASFRQLGDALEGTHKHYVALFFKIMQLVPSNDLQLLKNNSFGNVISSLCKFEPLQFIYHHALFDVPFSQWRNISQHSSYRVDINKDEITCTYGSRNQNTKVITKRELEYIMVISDRVHSIHKIALDFMIVELLNEINLAGGIDEISMETIVGDITSNLSASGFPVRRVRKNGFEMTFESTDRYNKNKAGFADALYQVSCIAKLLQEKGVTPIFSLFSDAGKKITEGKFASS